MSVKSSGVTPRQFLSTVLKEVEGQIKAANKGGPEISLADYARLPKGLKAIVDEFTASGKETVKAADLLASVKSDLKKSLGQSFVKGELLQNEVKAVLKEWPLTSPIGARILAKLRDRGVVGEEPSAPPRPGGGMVCGDDPCASPGGRWPGIGGGVVCGDDPCASPGGRWPDLGGGRVCGDDPCASDRVPPRPRRGGVCGDDPCA